MIQLGPQYPQRFSIVICVTIIEQDPSYNPQSDGINTGPGFRF